MEPFMYVFVYNILIMIKFFFVPFAQNMLDKLNYFIFVHFFIK